jgi:DtxR family Mn-dependent transcriptional regulator
METHTTLTPSQENYLQAIAACDATGTVRLSDLARALELSVPSVTRAVSILVTAGFVDHEPYGSVELTDAGRGVAARLVRRRRCVARVLIDVLGMPETDAQPVIHRVEHVVDDDLCLRLEALADLALSSPAWMRRLQHRLALRVNGGQAEGTGVGQAQVHAGRVRG